MVYKFLVLFNLLFFTYKCQVNLEIVLDSSLQNYQLDKINVVFQTVTKKNLTFLKKTKNEYKLLASGGDSILVLIEGFKTKRILLSNNKNIILVEPNVHFLGEVIITNQPSPKNVLDSIKNHLKKNYNNNISYLFTEIIEENNITKKKTNINFEFNPRHSSCEIINIIELIDIERICYKGIKAQIELKHLIHENPLLNNFKILAKQNLDYVSHITDYIPDTNYLFLNFVLENINGSLFVDKRDWSIKEYFYSVSNRKIGDIALCDEFVCFSYRKINEKLVCYAANRSFTLKSLKLNCSSTILTLLNLK